MPACPKAVPDMTALTISGRLQSAIKFSTKVMRRTGPAGQIYKYFGHCLTQTRHMLYIRADLVYGNTGYDFTSYFWLAFTKVRKPAENAASDGFGSTCGGAAFCLPQQLVGILLVFLQCKFIIF